MKRKIYHDFFLNIDNLYEFLFLTAAGLLRNEPNVFIGFLNLL